MRKKKFQYKYFIIAALMLLLSGCASGDMVDDDTVTDGTNIENEDPVICNDKNDADTLEGVGDSIAGEEEGGGERDPEEMANTTFAYSMNEDFIVNYNEVFAENEVFAKLAVPDNIVGGEDIVGEFCEGFPEELQQLLLYNYDSKSEGDDAWKSYLADYEVILNDGTTDIPFDDLESDVGFDYYRLHVIDIDSDGEDEYISIQCVGNEPWTVVDIIKYYNDRWHVIANGSTNFGDAVVKILKYEGNTYFLIGSILVCWNDEYDSADPNDTKWNVMAVDRKVAGYTPNELYGREGDSIDYLAGMDLENIENNAERFPNGGKCGGYFGTWFMVARYDWEQEYDGKTYLYVVSGFDYIGGWPQDDYLLTIFEEGDGCMEAVKVYYLKGLYCLSFIEDNKGIDAVWELGGRL